MRRGIVVSFLVTVVTLGGALLAATGHLKPQGDYYANPPAGGKTNLSGGTGCNCHGATTFSLAINGPTQLYPGQAATYTAAASTSTALNGTRLGLNVAQTGGALAVTNTAALQITGGEVLHKQSPAPLTTVSSGAASYSFIYTLSGGASVGTSYTLAAVGAAGFSGGWAHATNKSVTAIRPSNPSGLAPTATSSGSISLSWSGSGPEYRLLYKTGPTAPASPTDGTATIVDLGASPATVSGLAASTQYSFAVYGRATYSAQNTFSSASTTTTASTSAAVATSWYVNVGSGDDGNSGTSSGSPFKTITKAMSLAVSGDTINVAPGTYLWAPPPC